MFKYIIFFASIRAFFTHHYWIKAVSLRLISRYESSGPSAGSASINSGGCFTAGSSSGFFGASLGSVCILFTLGSSSSESSDSSSFGALGVFLGCLYIIFNADLPVIVSSCCPKRSPSLIHLTLSLYADNLAGSSLIFLHLLDTILR